MRLKINGIFLGGRPHGQQYEGVEWELRPGPCASVCKDPYTGLMQMANVTRLATGCDEGLCEHYNESDVMDAMDGADVIVVCLGTGNQVEKEFIDKSSLDLPGEQLQLLQDVVYHKKGRCILC